jgi:Mg2+ and Co2+ transporter CorA
MIQRIHEVQQGMQNTNSPKWPKGEFHTKQKVKLMYAGLEADYECLLQRVRMLHDRCNESIGVVMNSMAIDESREAIVQAKRVSKLTLIAFIFVPLSFTTSFFSMQVREFDSHPPPIWAWFVTSIPVLIMAFLFFSIENWKRMLRHHLSRANYSHTHVQDNS